MAAHPGTLAPRIAAMLAVVALAGTAAVSAQTRQAWRIVPEDSQLVVHVWPAGAFAAFLHAHHFVPDQWHGTIDVDPVASERSRIEVVIVADSLRNQQPDLSAEDRQAVAQQVRSDTVLDVAAYPEIRIIGNGVRVAATDEEGEGEDRSLEGALLAEVTLRGVTQPVEIPFTARWSHDRLRAAGSVSLNQTDFGIEPYRRFLGTVRVADEVDIEFAIEAVPENAAE